MFVDLNEFEGKGVLWITDDNPSKIVPISDLKSDFLIKELEHLEKENLYASESYKKCISYNKELLLNELEKRGFCVK